MKPDNFRRFVVKVLASPDTLTRLDLVLLSARGTAQTVDSVKVENPQDFGSEERLDELITNLCDTAQRDANGWGTPSKYCLRARFADSNDNPRSTVVSVSPDDGEESDDFGGEQANATGLVAQAHRHTEAFARQLVAQTQIFTTHATETMARMSESLQRHERDKMAFMELLEELHTKRHERDIELHREERKDKTIARVVGSLAPLLPVAAGKMLLGPKAPSSVSNAPQMVALKELAASLSPEELAGLQNALGPQKFAAILEVLTSVAEQGERSDAEAERNGSDSDEPSSADESGANGRWH